MNRITRSLQTVLVAGAFGACLLCLSQPALAGGAQTQAENTAAQKVASRLGGKQYKNVKVSVENGIATLGGTVDLYEYKADAEKRADHTKGITAVRNQIEVAGPSVADNELRAKLAEELTYDRVGFGHVFDALTVAVHDGVVTVGGHSHNYFDRDSALALVSTTPGVKDVIDDIQVDPVSTMDEQIRFAVARAVYGYPTLNKYALNPAKPIRISVQNGHVTLYGVVDSKADSDTAYLRADSVPGVFSVKNELQIANQPAGQEK